MEKEKHLRDVDLAAGTAALVVVDMENEFCKPEGKYYLGPGVEPVIRRTGELMGRCRGAGLPVIFVRSVRYPTDTEFTRFGMELFLIEGTNGPVIVPELKPRPGEPVVEKHSHDCFYRTEMDAVLQRMGIGCQTHRVIVTGVMSNICVYHAVLGFHVRDFYTILPLDCTIGSPQAEDFVIAQFSNFAYEYNVWLTTSQRIRIAGRNR